MTDLGEGQARARLEERLGRDLLRFITCGSVDDGKSTLIGRLLVETQAVPEDQMASLEADSRRHGTCGGDLDYALLLDGLAAEREQAITIDVAYRYLSTSRRTFIVADTPGHEQYTRNMATGASTADLALLLVDARKGLSPQTMRHATIVRMVGVRALVLLVNKMDRVDWSEARFRSIVADFATFTAKLGVDHVTAIPVSALRGDNVTTRSRHMPWYEGPALLEHLEQVPVDAQSARRAPIRFPVQWVNRPDPEFRGFAGTLVSGTLLPGQGLRVLPRGSLVTVSEIWRDGRKVPEAVAGEAITLIFDEEVDVSRGDLCCAVGDPAHVADQFEARMLWLVEDPLHPGRSFRLKMGTRIVHATVTRIKHQLQVETLEHLAARSLDLNAVAVCNLSTDAPLAFDPFAENRHTGSFILIDRLTNETVAAGVVQHALRRATNIVPEAFVVNRAARAAALGQRPAVLWFTGLSGAGKSTLANLVEQRLHAQGRHTFILDGDNVRHGLCRDLGFTETDRIENLRRVSEVARLMLDAGLIVLVTLISPYQRDRERARGLFDSGEFFEIHVDVPLAVAEARDPKGLYRKARRGELAHFTGVDAPYEPPETPELRIDTSRVTPEEAVDHLMALLDRSMEA